MARYAGEGTTMQRFMCIYEVLVWTGMNVFRVYVGVRHFSSSAQLLVVFALNDLLDKPWSQVSNLLPPDACLAFSRAQ